MSLKGIRGDLYVPSVASTPKTGKGFRFCCRRDALLVLVLSATLPANIEGSCGWTAEQVAGSLRRNDETHPSEPAPPSSR